MNLLIDLDQISDRDSGKVFSQLLLYPKYKSLVAMAIVGLPIPKAIIIGDSSQKSKIFCQSTLKKWEVTKVTVRTDVVGGAVQAPSSQGCQVVNVWPTTKNYLKEGYLPMVISAGDVFHNVFSANILVDPTNIEKVYIEGVGSGFCATDISKRDIVNESGWIVEGKLRNSRLVSPQVYQEQVGLMFNNQIQKEEERSGKRFPSKKKALEWVKNFLAKKGALILEHPLYQPVASKYIKQIWDLVPLVVKAEKIMGLGKQLFIVYCSFVLEKGKVNLYFWDIHPYGGYKHG